MMRLQKLVMLCGCCLALLLVVHRTATAEVRSIQEFNTFESKWEKLTKLTWTLEGRYGVISDRTMQMKNCRLPFRLADGVLKPSSTVRVIEVQGRIEPDADNELEFVVTSLKPRGSDLETLRLKRGSITTTEPQEWYDVAQWGQQRGEFYKDDELLEEVKDLNRNGLLTEKRLLKLGDFKGLLGLADKAHGFGLAPRFIQELRHEAYHIRADLVDEGKSDGASLLHGIAQTFPGATIALPELPMPLTTKYREAPVDLYANTDDEQRPVLHRIFYVDEMVKHIARDAKSDGSNGITISERLAKEVPERPDLATLYRTKELDYRMSRVGVMTRSEMLDLAQIFEDEQLPAKAVTVKQEWLKVREPILAEDGARGYAELAEEWEQLLQDEQTATKYYLKSVQRDPQFQPAVRWLTEHGYVKVDRRWMLAVDVPRADNSAMNKAIEDGRLSLGMTPEQALATMSTKPDSVIRFATNDTASELWVYESSKTLIRFERKPRSDTRVVAIETLKP